MDTGDVTSDGGGGLGVELAWVHGPLSVQSEYKQFWIGRDQSSERDRVQGAYAYASYFLTGEHRVYKTKAAVFGRVTPKKSFHPMKGEWGAWEIGARYSWLDLNSGTLRGGEEWDVTAGINWYLYSNVRLMVNYVYGRVKDSGVSRDDTALPPLPTHVAGHVNLIETRVQIEF